MEYSPPGPTLQPKQREDGTWCAEASWPNAPTEEVGYLRRRQMPRIGSFMRRTNISGEGPGCNGKACECARPGNMIQTINCARIRAPTASVGSLSNLRPPKYCAGQMHRCFAINQPRLVGVYGYH